MQAATLEQGAIWPSFLIQNVHPHVDNLDTTSGMQQQA